MGDEPAGDPLHLGRRPGHAGPFERHDDQAGQDAAAHAGHPLGRAVPRHHDHRIVAARTGPPQALQVELAHARGEVADLLADPGRQIGVHDRGQPLARRHPRLSQQDIGPLARRRQFGVALAIEQHRTVQVAPGHARRPAVQIDAVEVRRHRLRRLGRAQSEDVHLPRRQGHRPVREDQGLVFRLQLDRLGRHAETDMARHGAAVRAADDVVMAASLHHHARRLDRPLARPPRLAHLRDQGRVHEGPDHGVAVEDIVNCQPPVLARHRHLRRRLDVPGAGRRAGGAGGQQGDDRKGGCRQGFQTHEEQSPTRNGAA